MIAKDHSLLQICVGVRKLFLHILGRCRYLPIRAIQIIKIYCFSFASVMSTVCFLGKLEANFKMIPTSYFPLNVAPSTWRIIRCRLNTRRRKEEDFNRRRREKVNIFNTHCAVETQAKHRIARRLRDIQPPSRALGENESRAT